jgi:hypothetical protein
MTPTVLGILDVELSPPAVVPWTATSAMVSARETRFLDLLFTEQLELRDETWSIVWSIVLVA